MNWAQYVLRALALVPVVVQGIEVIAAGAPGATKKELALTSLGFSSAVAESVLPGQQQQIRAAAAAVSQVIDATVGVFNAVGQFKKGPIPAAK